jgi:hypothetical protein
MDILVTVTLILFKMAVVRVAFMGYREIGIIVITLEHEVWCYCSVSTADHI